MKKKPSSVSASASAAPHDKTKAKTPEQMSAQYSADVDAMVVAAHVWKLLHPQWQTELQFVPIHLANVPRDKSVVIVAPLDAMVVRKVSGNAVTADLLTTLDKAAVHGGGASLLMAEAVVEHVFGIAHFARPAGTAAGTGKVDA